MSCKIHLLCFSIFLSFFELRNLIRNKNQRKREKKMSEQNEIISYKSPVNRLSVFEKEEYYLLYSDGDVPTEYFQGVFEALLNEMDNHPYRKLLIDIEKMKSTTLAGRTWLVLNFVPRFYSKYEGVFEVGILNTKNFFEGITIDLLAKAVMALGFHINITFHKDIDSAKSRLGIF